ncbi:MAG: sigma-70 family RNA polymerase sigma factor [Thermomicrobiales bacterium]|nr:sigma-70 family RNA polymerase sigma factor [Thermomicrobiales bacterium]
MAIAIYGVPAAPDLRDLQSFSAFYDQALPVVYGYFLRRTGGEPALAEDLTQETFLAAVTQIDRGTRVDAPMPWLIGIARHRLIDHYRATSRAANRVVSLGEWIDDQPDGRDDFGPILDRAMAAASLDAMPASQRLVVVLRYLDGLSVPEIASQIGKSVHAVESLLARGRATFKRHYLEHGHE